MVTNNLGTYDLIKNIFKCGIFFPPLNKWKERECWIFINISLLYYSKMGIYFKAFQTPLSEIQTNTDIAALSNFALKRTGVTPVSQLAKSFFQLHMKMHACKKYLELCQTLYGNLWMLFLCAFRLGQRVEQRRGWGCWDSRILCVNSWEEEEEKEEEEASQKRGVGVL